MNKEKKGAGNLKKALSFIIIAAVMLFWAVFSVFMSFVIPVNPGDNTKERVYIKYGYGFSQILSELENRGFLRNKTLFKAVLWPGERYKRIRAGEYELSKNMSSLEVIKKILSGDVVKHKMVIPEGFDVRDIASVLSAAGLADEKRFLELAFDRKFLKSIGIDYLSAEGFLFPDTYSFVIGEGEERIIKTMYLRFKEKTELDMKKVYSAGGRRLTGYSILKMASLVEKESKLDIERPLVASVFYNRMNSKEGYEKRLESCATVRYGLNKKTGPLLNRHLMVDTPYNTYIYIGLPPTPICNPGIESIHAALNPADTDYRFFVTESGGAHTFSESLKEHNAAKRKNTGRR
ncbi:MAG: endolytic transglycosylase MltG [Candidatus Goldiibacteriota bacterium]